MGRLKLKTTIVICATLIGIMSIIYTVNRYKSGSVNRIGNHFTIGSDTVKGYQHVYIATDSIRIYITDGQQNNSTPVSDGKYVAWAREVQGKNQIFLYEIAKKTTLQLSFVGVNSKPSVSDGRVVWEHQDSTSTQIFYFDGSEVSKLTDAKSAVQPSIKGDQIIYAEEMGGGQWRTQLYTISDGSSKTITEGSAARAGNPRFESDAIKTDFTE